MNHVFQLSHEEYEKIAAYAEQQEQTPEDLFHKWVDEVIRQIEASQTFEAEDEIDEPIDEEALRAEHPLLRIAGIFSFGEPGWADKIDEYLAESYIDTHADEK